MGLLTSAVGPTDPGPRGAHAHAAPLLQLQPPGTESIARRLALASNQPVLSAMPCTHRHMRGRGSRATDMAAPPGQGARREAGATDVLSETRCRPPWCMQCSVLRAEEESSHASSARRRRGRCAPLPWTPALAGQPVAKQLGCTKFLLLLVLPLPKSTPRFLHVDSAVRSSHRDRGTCTLLHDNGRAELTKHRRKKKSRNG